MIIVGQFVTCEGLEFTAKHGYAFQLRQPSLAQCDDLCRHAMDIDADNPRVLLLSWSRLREPARDMTVADTRSQRILVGRRGGQKTTSNSQFISVRRPARTCVLQVPRGPDQHMLATCAEGGNET